MINIANLNEATTMLLVSPADLKEFAFNVIEEYKDQQLEKKAEEEDKMISSHKVCELFGISHATLWRWTTANLIICRKVGGKNYYSQKSVERVMRGETV